MKQAETGWNRDTKVERSVSGEWLEPSVKRSKSAARERTSSGSIENGDKTTCDGYLRRGERSTSRSRSRGRGRPDSHISVDFLFGNGPPPATVVPVVAEDAEDAESRLQKQRSEVLRQKEAWRR